MELTSTPTSTASHDAHAPVNPHPGVESPDTPEPPPAAPAVDTEPPAGASHPDPAVTAASKFTLHRSRTDRMLGGVCGGLAESLDVDATLLRIVLVALTVLGFGLGVVFYLAAWILAPQR